jgi:hypothetical protein
VQTLYLVQSGPSPTTAPTPKITTGTATKTLIQLVHTTRNINVVEWGISFDGSAAATGVECELIQTTTVAATVTAYVANDITLYTDPAGTASGLSLGTAASGYNSSNEGSVVAPVRVGGYEILSPTNLDRIQLPLDQEFQVAPNGILRVRVTAAAAVNVVAYVKFTLS